MSVHVVMSARGDITRILRVTEKIVDAPFDMVVANINRNVIEESAKELRHLIKQGGTMLYAGFFTTDAPALSKFLENNAFTQVDKMTEGKWTLLKFMAS